ncbi:MAG TPA: 8-amino-7-oxononanoate synthase [Wolbachia sp.]|uniref:aminotransferase class I/II-fold pyridoxal phosphate-dependent enzyme n=1 Tax=Wolbachia endosymbiont of Pentalonia nigronervosa TaxID=1301914 RepID=UPI000EC1FC0E|nr:8-amino-7-oxononanoate synthase [Wolbachia endosymbiont of Pentalonia nigronervosa]MBD0391832.1 8-amino-7-oxononanoate synthase [Wolbachia endosymbiont of Pentalonia nigronervosa]HCE59313.1 8-amino-7-oxononanoate synthase [Wolbachia sp.]
MYHLYHEYCNTLQNKRKYRQLPDVTLAPDFIDFSTNDYFNLSKSEILLEAAKLAGMQFGVGSTGSRLLSGNTKIFEDFEIQIAQDKKTESSLILNSGFQGNVTVLASLLDQSVLGSKPVVFFDKLNHASLYQAVFLSGAELVRYRHNDMDHLSNLLAKFANVLRPKFIVTETIFGMDGDIVPIEEIFTLSKEYGAFLYLDEAHATGVIGDRGYGLSTSINLQEIPHLVLGTFSKALGCFGAYVACSQVIKNYLINKCAGFIYSTSLSPIVIGAAAKAWSLMPHLSDQRQTLYLKATNLRDKLKMLGFDTGDSTMHIIPIILSDEDTVMNAKAKLLEQGIVVSAIRPPTVPPGTSRLRVALNVNHSEENINRLLHVLKQV